MIRKSLLLALLFCGFAMPFFAQNVQLHYDLGRTLYGDIDKRPSVTTTVEMFKPDRWGSTFLFTDLDYKNDGTVGAYWEIAREFNLTKNKQWAAHVEYNGGMTTGETPKGYWGGRYQHAALVGGAWNWASKDFSKLFSLQLMYKYHFKNAHTGARPFSGFQLTEVWSMQIAKGLCTFNGFCDLWYNPDVKGKLIVVSEPQFWVNLNRLKGMQGVNLSLGTEVEISNNFVWNDRGENNRFYAIPTVAAKWTF